MVSGSEILARAFTLANLAYDEFDRRTAAHAVYFAIFQYAGETLEAKTGALDWRFRWNTRRPDGRLAGEKGHGTLQSGWRYYFAQYGDPAHGNEVQRLLRAAHNLRVDADYHYDLDFPSAKLNTLLSLAEEIQSIIDSA
ncbi:MAG: hypothetical protein F4X64_09265 [Chloroflexi bacterium]|nr:hypothetical protein [Chloroflexota bacterium]